MNLETSINSAPLLRSWDLPDSARHVCCIAMREDLVLLPSFLERRPKSKIRLLLIPDLPANNPEYMRFSASDGMVVIPVCGLRGVERAANLEKVILCRPGPSGAVVAAMLCRSLTACGVRDVYLYAGRERGFGARKALPDFYRQHEARLQKVYGLLADETSREVYAARIKALMTGEAGYLPLSAHQEYYHPLVRPEYGDIMLDGGVSDMVGAQMQFAQSVGETGRIFGFEPIPAMAAIARKKLAGFPRYHLQTAGLGESTGQVCFKNLRDSSHMVLRPDDGDSILCQMTSVDDFVGRHRLGRISCIKLDVEGAEMLALAGSRQTILKHRPKLIVCLYHKPSDMIDIPLFIHELVKEYALYIAHSSCVFTDTILYACPIRS
ncbi:FkbM family methyltransferase [Desulfovibrio sp. SGI.169]|uniref:FkbM family methyltransferase n=1 Tax=Desulfovibrio sp. SGI.169 TaxID=3420561 RepID=UPI003D059FA1